MHCSVGVFTKMYIISQFKKVQLLAVVGVGENLWKTDREAEKWLRYTADNNSERDLDINKDRDTNIDMDHSEKLGKWFWYLMEIL